ncbi:MAG: hydrogenase maturation nickel metallochaperone HypA [Acidobacteriota bacterium]
MHESGLIEDLLQKVESLVRANGGRRAVVIEVSIGPLAFIEADHLREHFKIAAPGTVAEGAELRVTVSEDPSAVVLQSVEVEIE